MSTVLQALGHQLMVSLQTAIVAAVIGIVITPVAQFGATWVKNALNVQGLRYAKIDSVTSELSTYVFEAANVQEALSRPIVLRSSLEGYIDSYNRAITAVRSHEYSNRATLKKLWGDKTAQDYKKIMAAVRALDGVFHEASPKLEDILAPANNQKISLSPDALAPVTSRSAPMLRNLETEVADYLESLADLRTKR